MKRKLIAAMVVGLMVFGVQMSFIVDSFPGFHSSGDCTLCHNNPANAYNVGLENDGIILDGLDTDDQWQNYQYRRTMVPVASRFGSVHMFVTVIFAQNTSHFMILANWEDPTIDGTDDAKYGDSDGIAFMFNINETTFDSGYGMGGPRETGRAVDLISWKPVAAATGTEQLNQDTPISVQGNINDFVYTNGSNMADDNTNWEAAAVHGNVSDHNEENYQVEFVRPLVTSDVNDVQFAESTYYQFAVGIFNSSSGSSHWTSPPQSVFVYNPNNSVNTFPDGLPPATEVTRTETKTETETSTVSDISTVENTVTETQTETEGKEPLAFLPILLALFAVPVIVLIRRK